MATVQRRLSAILAADAVGYSKLIRSDESGTVAAMKRLQSDIIHPMLAEHSGRIVKLMGDGLLAEFPSVVEAVTFAVECQAALEADAAGKPAESRIQFRMGVNLGDVIIDGDDIQGDGVNVAARLEGICEPAGLCISDLVYQAIDGKTDLIFQDLGGQELKNIETPIRVWQWRQGASPAKAETPVEQQIKFCTASDGTNIAYAAIGQGPPLVKAPNWMNHLEYDWQSPVWRHVLRELSRDNTLLRFDQRGNGLSDRQAVDITFESMVSDMAMVVDTAGLDRFDLLGISQGCLCSIAYAVRNPERVRRLVLYGGFAKGALAMGSESLNQRMALQKQLIQQGWGKNNPAFRQFFTSLFMPGASKEQMEWFNDLQQKTTSSDVAARLFELAASGDVTALLAQVQAPPLVLHCRDDAIASFEGGRRMAAKIPNARFVALDGENHMIMEDEPAWSIFIQEIRQFLAETA